MKRADFNAIGGFNEHYFTHYQDVDLCLRLRQLGKRIIVTPRAQLFHHECTTRKDYWDYVDYSLLLDQWQDAIEAGDPYYNPNLDPAKTDYSWRE
jgi:GT2 family glycosyltransferase